MKTFFMNRDKTFDEIQVIHETPHIRKVKFLSGKNKGKTTNAHPKGVAWGNMYPRIFEAKTTPQNTFIYNGRCLVGNYDFDANPAATALIPLKETYFFQPITADIIDSINFRKNIILTGPSGVGKTSCINQIARAIKQPTVRINFNAETRLADLIGKMTLVNGQTVWQDGVIPNAMRNGYWLIFDEIDYAPPEIMSLIYPILERQPTLTLKENSGEVIIPASNFLCFATSNTIGAMQSKRHKFSGTNRISEALLNRFDVFHMKNMDSKQELKLVRELFPQLQLSFAKKIVEFAESVRASEEKKDISFVIGDFSTRQVISWAEKTALHRSAYRGAKLSWLDKVSTTEQDAAINALQLKFGSKGMKGLDSKGKTVAAKRQRSVGSVKRIASAA